MATEPQLQPTPVSGGLEEFLELEAKIARVGEALRLAREARARVEAEISSLRSTHEELQQIYNLTEQDLQALRREREEVRLRVAKLVEQLDGLVSE
jgi:chromosome segregation ATPase